MSPGSSLNTPLKALQPVMDSRSHGHRTEDLCCYKRRGIVRADTCHANDPIFSLRARDVAVPFIKAIRIRCVSSRL